MNETALYYIKPYESRFQARIKSIEEIDGSWHIELNQTLFYPEGGGQPADRGFLNGVPVRDVQKENGRIIHITEKNPGTGPVTGELDWDARYHFMVQHTGQHLISAALKETDDINTLSVHLGKDSTTIEVDRSDLAEDILEKVEKNVNLWIRENHPVDFHIAADASELPKYSIRRETKLASNIRIVQIGDKDAAACGGVHVGRTGEIGLIKYTGMEKIRGRLRLFWKIGDPAYSDYRQKHTVVNCINSLVCSQTDTLTDRINNIIKEKSEMAERIKNLENLSAENMVKTLCESITHYPPLIAQELPERSSEFFKQTVKKMSEVEGISFLLTMKSKKRIQWALYLPRDSEFHFDQFKKNCLSLIGGKGGGKGPLWQGSGDRIDQSENFTKAFLELEGIC